MQKQQPKAQVRAETGALVEAYLAKGGTVERVPFGESGNGYRGNEWKRAAQGDKVATGQEVADERSRRALIALENQDLELVVALMSYDFDKEIKFDIESDRGGPRDYRELKTGKRAQRVVVHEPLPEVNVAPVEQVYTYRVYGYKLKGVPRPEITPAAYPDRWLLVFETTDHDAFLNAMNTARDLGVVVKWEKS